MRDASQVHEQYLTFLLPFTRQHPICIHNLFVGVVGVRIAEDRLHPFQQTRIHRLQPAPDVGMFISRLEI